MQVFEKARIGNVILKNRIIRSATFEGMCDKKGYPSDQYYQMYAELSKNNIGGIITGFAYVSPDGKAMHPGQAGIHDKNSIGYLKKLTDTVHKNGSKLFLQIAHTGRQTKRELIERDVFGVSDKKSFYFQEKPLVLMKSEIERIINDFTLSAYHAKEAGFDGIQLHAAHGYLVHQFLLKSVNNRRDVYGINKATQIGSHFLSETIDSIRNKCGKGFPILVKISGSDDYLVRFSKKQFIHLILFLESKKVDGIEISYGTMDYALNIFRGEIPVDIILKNNPVYRVNHALLRYLWKISILPWLSLKIKKFTPMYNLEYAKIARQYTSIPIMTVGGIRKGEEIFHIIENENIDFVSLCRPFIIEPDFVIKLIKNEKYISKCSNCNICSVMCDSINGTRCYQRSEVNNEF
jgi:2,4-dienoyl-CoA reductase-like NADH-dependent reductase (Old Yellow Enzyme family)